MVVIANYHPGLDVRSMFEFERFGTRLSIIRMRYREMLLIARMRERLFDIYIEMIRMFRIMERWLPHYIDSVCYRKQCAETQF